MSDQLEEFVFVESKKEPNYDAEVVIYRDMDDLGRVFVTRDVLRRFFIEQPAFKIALDGETVLYEIEPAEAIRIIELSDNSYAPYHVRYQNFDFDNEIKDNALNNKILNVTDEITVYRDIDNPDIAYVDEAVIKRFCIKPTKSLFVGDKEVFAVTPVQIINIINNANNKYAPYAIKYVDIELDFKEENEVLPVEEEEEFVGPRRRNYGESDDHYAAYFEGFYDGIGFARKANIQTETLNSKDEMLKQKYSDYLTRKYYDTAVNRILKNNVEKTMKR